ncbi:MAG: hypothetical protein HY301_06280 [Verrucomicrobia bacterium]|nr:hypothetical protein [Verrucomicrobiota bacterium]
MRILLLEDLPSFADALQQSLEARQELRPVGIERIATEYEFRRRLPELARESFQVAIFDVMVRWCSLEELDTPEAQELPPEVVEERDGIKKWRSGVRCRRLFAKALQEIGASPVPCVFYSVLDLEDLGEELNGDTPLIVKQGELEPLVQEIARLTGRR